MKDFTARFAAPLVSVRPRGGRLFEGSSPSLHRRIRLFVQGTESEEMLLDLEETGTRHIEGDGVPARPRPPQNSRRPRPSGFQLDVHAAGDQRHVGVAAAGIVGMRCMRLLRQVDLAADTRDRVPRGAEFSVVNRDDGST